MRLVAHEDGRATGRSRVRSIRCPRGTERQSGERALEERQGPQLIPTSESASLRRLGRASRRRAQSAGAKSPGTRVASRAHPSRVKKSARGVGSNPRPRGAVASRAVS